MNVLFYSNRCPTCANLTTLMKNSNLLQYFKLVCVDGRLKEMPPNLTTVPTLMVANVNKLLVGKETFQWVETMRFIRQKQQMQIQKQNEGPIGHNNSEMGGFSDDFAYKDIDESQPKAFVKVGDETKNIIFTAPKMGKIKESEQNQLLRKAESRRNEQNRVFDEYAKKQQLHEVMMAEQRELINDMNQK